MQDTTNHDATEKVTYTLARVLFIFCFLLSLIPLYAVDKMAAASNHWFLVFKITCPWLMLMIGGTSVWMLAKRQRLDRPIATALLIIIGISTENVYELIAKFATP